VTILLVAAMLVPLIVGALLNLWRRGYDNGFRDGSRVAPDIRAPRPGIAEIDALVKRDLLLHQPDPACAIGATRFEHDIMGLCPCH